MKNDKQTGIIEEEDEEAGEKIKPNKTERFEQCAIHLLSAGSKTMSPRRQNWFRRWRGRDEVAKIGQLLRRKKQQLVAQSANWCLIDG